MVFELSRHVKSLAAAIEAFVKRFGETARLVLVDHDDWDLVWICLDIRPGSFVWFEAQRDTAIDLCLELWGRGVCSFESRLSPLIDVKINEATAIELAMLVVDTSKVTAMEVARLIARLVEGV